MAAIDMFLPRVRREKHYRGFNPLNKDFSDEELRQRYRFGRESIEFIANELRADLERNTRKRTALSVEEQVMIALRFYGSGSQLQVVGDTMGYDKSTVSRVVRDVTDALVDRKDQYIKWPTERQKNINKRAFYEKAGFPNVIGCIDGTHVHIQAPTEDEPAYVNRKGFHSINVQVICDSQGIITNVNAKWPGSAHDAHVFRTSAVGRYLEDNYQGIEQGLLLGDSGYPCRPFLLTPHRQPANRMQERFNRSHCSTRSTVERVFGIWKKRFHVLGSEIRMKPGKACRIITACAVLHNIATLRLEPDVDGEQEEDIQPVIPAYVGRQDGQGIRDHIAINFFS
ncbi:Hypothetical predicted protein [Mytilus galloprovincialis]|uniref:Putative nuclease HARBI1 n=1 Tax=Mytilus galloprovincialis TaxID=29158 RepID=A0A8B6GVU5_MYTGA|nr:Hypothetical predicted protein [Mytilus galloprovincialis]